MDRLLSDDVAWLEILYDNIEKSKILNLFLPPPSSSVRDDRSLHLHGPEKQLSHGRPPAWLLRLLLHPGLDQLPHDSHQRPHVPGPEKAQMNAAGSVQRPKRII